MKENIIINFVFGLIPALILLVLCWSALTEVVIPFNQELDAQNSVYQGEVIDKKIVNPSRGLFSSRGMYYCVIIKGSYEYDGATKYVQKEIAVDKETYTLLNVGDFFNSKTLEITNGTKNAYGDE